MARPATNPPTQAEIAERSRNLDGQRRPSPGDRLSAGNLTRKARRAGQRSTRSGEVGRTYTLDSAYAAVPALDPPRDPEVVSREAKEEKAGRTVRELAEG